MARTIVDITMSLDGYVTAPGAGPEHGLGVGGEPLHAWVGHDNDVLAAAEARTGAVIMGRNTFDVIDGPKGWAVAPGGAPPIFVLSHSVPDKVRLGDRVKFVTELKDAVSQAKAAAGDKDVTIMGGGAVCHAFLAAGLADILILHIAPIILGGGTPLFPAGPAPSIRLERESSLSTPDAEHVTYRVLN